LLFCVQANALESLSYSGRLVQTNGAPVVGSVNLRAELAYTNNLGTILCTDDISGVPLTKGVFHVKLDFACTGGKTLTQVLSQAPAGESVAIQVTDMSNSKAYSFQAIHAMPFANVASQLTQMGAADGEFLKWNNSSKKWEPGAVSGASGGTVTSVTASSPLSVATGTSTPDISIAAASGSTSGYLSAADWNTFNNKEGTIAGGTASQFYRGDKSWQTLDTSAVPENVNLYFTNARALGVPLTGFTTAVGAIVATDTTLAAFGKTQGQINAINSASANYLVKNSTDSVTGVVNVGTTGLLQLVYVPVGLNDATNKAYVDSEVSNSAALKVNKAGDTVTGVLTLDNDLKIKGGSNHVTVKGHATSANYNLTLPQTAGTAGYVLATDGTGATTWASPAVGSSNITDGSITDADVNATAGIAQSKIANLTSDLSGKEPTIAAGTATQYWKGDKTWSSLQTDVQALVLSGFATGANSSLTNTDSISGAFGKVQGQIDAINSTIASKEASLAAGSASQFYRGDKSWQTLNGGAVANTPAGTIAATTTQNAINELDTEKQDKLTATSVVDNRELRFYELPGNGTFYSSLKSPDDLAANISYTLPLVAPTAGQVLSSNASGIMSWISIPSAPVTTVFGRSGVVTATAGDYTASQVTYSPAGNIAATTIQAALNEIDSEKQGLITAGTTSEYFRGDKTFVDFGTDVRSTLLTTFAVGANSTILAADTTLAAFGKVQGQINATNTAVGGKEPTIPTGTTAQYIRGDKTLSTFATDAINSVLSTFALNGTSKPSVSTSDSVVGAFGKVQKFINDINSDYVSKSANQTINGSLAINSVTGFITVPTPINPTDAANKSYVDGFGQWSQGSGPNAGDIYRSSGNVGIGTAAPVTRFNMTSDGTTKTIYDANEMFQFHGNNSNYGTVSGDNITLGIGVHDNANDGVFTGINEGAWIGSLTNAPFVIRTNNTEQMRIDTSGRVGIGVTPSNKFEIKSTGISSTPLNIINSANTNTLVKVIENATGNGSLFVQDSTSTYSLYMGSDSNMPWIGTSSNHDLRIVTNAAEKVRVTAAGDVGVGTSTPASKVDVIGKVSVHGRAYPWRWKTNSVGSINFGTTTWVDLATIALTLPAAADIEMRFDGSIYAVESGIHCSFRFLIDGSPISDSATYGDAIIMGNTPNWWQSISRTRWFDNMAAGAHTIKVQGSAQPTATSAVNCRVDGTDYSRIRFTIMGYPAM
jgi:hypothetical protein